MLLFFIFKSIIFLFLKVCVAHVNFYLIDNFFFKFMHIFYLLNHFLMAPTLKKIKIPHFFQTSITFLKLL